MPGKVLVVMGSDSDLPVMKACLAALEDLGVPYECRVCSAHRTPEAAHRMAGEAAGRGFKVVIAAAGMAAHLAGVLAAGTTLPVIGVPLDSSALAGVDSLYATVQMPGGIPVASMAIGKAGARNAGIFAAQILALGDETVARRLVDHKLRMAEEVLAKDRRLQQELGRGAPDESI